jgi:2-phospho-L-lactate/phosphoenolpyruvate guanylyltransferase
MEEREGRGPALDPAKGRRPLQTLGVSRDIWAVVPIKERDGAKQRLSGFLTPGQRQELAKVMAGEVLGALAGATGLAGILVVTLDPVATRLAERVGARVVTEGTREGHTGAVMAGRAVLLRERRGGMLTLPGDIPCVTAAEVDAVLAAHPGAPGFTIVPAHDELGSNTVVCSPPDAVPLRFGDNSYFPHLDAARGVGIEPTIVRLPGIAMDVDHPVDLAALLRLPQSAGTRTRAFLEGIGVPGLLVERGFG